MGNWKTDLANGQKVEREAAEILKAKGYSVEFNNTKTRDNLKLWDFTGEKDGKILAFEIKADFKYLETGNVAIEVFCVLESAADYFVYKLGDEFWYTTTNNLKIELSKEGRFLNGGDGGRSYMKLVNGDDFKKYCKKLN